MDLRHTCRLPCLKSIAVPLQHICIMEPSRAPAELRGYKVRAKSSPGIEVHAHSSHLVFSGISSLPAVLKTRQQNLRHALHLVFYHCRRLVRSPMRLRHAHQGEDVRDRGQSQERRWCCAVLQVATDKLARDPRATRDAQQPSLQKTAT